MVIRYKQLVPKLLLNDLKFAAVQQAFLLLFTALLLDGGNLFRWTGVAFIGFWLGVVAIAMKRASYSSRTDRSFVRFGSIVLAVIAVLAEPWIHRFIHW